MCKTIKEYLTKISLSKLSLKCENSQEMWKLLRRTNSNPYEDV